jgi:hypothetical protein
MPPFECFRNESYMIGYCCSKTRQAIFIEPKSVVSKSDCINGSPPLKTPNGEIQICVPNKQFECPVDYSCELNSYYGRYQCCQNQAASETNALQCPEGTSVQIHPVSGKPQKCNDDADCANFVNLIQIYLIDILGTMSKTRKFLLRSKRSQNSIENQSENSNRAVTFKWTVTRTNWLYCGSPMLD